MSFSRLFDQFSPTNYNLTLSLDKDNLAFAGSVLISGDKDINSKNVLLHAKNLDISEVTIDGQKTNFIIGPENDEIIIETSGNAKNILIQITFSGKITKPMHGLYPCYAKNGDVILATQFESHHAREVFPCIDEPEAKATFDLTLLTNKSEIVLGNMPVKSQKTNKDNLVTTFEQSPVMSTYLLAFVIGDLQAVTAKTSNGTEVNVWSSKDHETKDLEFALDTAVKVIEFFNDYFDTPYPLPKCDHVALPDFSSGAMENWGLITYREVCLIVDHEKTSTSVQEYVATVIAHELSHQWFGNLVTMKWWNDLWLNESFATVMEYIAINKIYPKWNIMLSFTAHEALAAFRRDSLSGVQAVKTQVNHPDEISTLFDPSIVYAKGARLLLMAFNMVGEKAFRQGLKNYFKKYAYKNTEGDDLWNELSATSETNITSVMNTWINQPGFPVLSVEKLDEELIISQKKYLLKGESHEETLWPIPLFANPKIGKAFLNDQNQTVKYIGELPLFNTRGGHYSVHYKNSEFSKYIRNKIKNEQLSTEQKLLYFNDLNLQARAGLGSIVDFFKALSANKNESAEPVWSVIAVGLSDARRLIENLEPAEKQMKALTFKLVKTQYDRLGWEAVKNEPLNDVKLRDLILSLAVYSEEPHVIEKAVSIYKSTDIHSIPADIRGIVLAAAVKFGGEDTFDKLVSAYPTETNSEIQQDIGGALTSTKQPKLAKKILSLIKDGSWVKTQDIDRFIVGLLANRWTRQLAWDWLTANWQWIEENFSSDKSYDNYPRYAASAFNNQQWLDNYVKFFSSKKDIVALKRNIELGEVEITNRIKWATRDQEKLITWLAKIV